MTTRYEAAVAALFNEVARVTSGRKVDVCSPEEVKRRVLSASHTVLDCDEALLRHRERVSSHAEMHAALDASRQRVLTARTALGAAVVGAQSVVSELEAALLAVSEEARLPHREVSVREVVQLSQRLGYVVSAPFGWAPPAPTTPFLNCAPYEAELRSSLLVYCQDTGQCANALSALAQAQAGPSVPKAAS